MYVQMSRTLSTLTKMSTKLLIILAVKNQCPAGCCKFPTVHCPQAPPSHRSLVPCIDPLAPAPGAEDWDHRPAPVSPHQELSRDKQIRTVFWGLVSITNWKGFITIF